jgi:predicted PurR-regulated permease PerM
MDLLISIFIFVLLFFVFIFPIGVAVSTIVNNLFYLNNQQNDEDFKER